MLTLTAGCGGPIPLERAIRPGHAQDYASARTLAPENPREAWYAWKAQTAAATLDQARAADQAISSTRNPFSANTDPDAVSRGAVLFREHCARCHGVDARGAGPEMLASHPTKNFHAFGKRLAVTLHGGAPRAWFAKIHDGHGEVVEYPDGPSRAMPAFGDKLAREQNWLVVTYLQSLDVHAKSEPIRGGG